jgi:predicted ATPase
VQLTSFVGREHELAELERLLPETRLLTLTGVGGVGKTRLALELATRVVEEFPGGVWLVDLSGLADAALIPQQIAQVLGLHESPDLPLVELLRNHLRKSEVLLLLDNCEHLFPSSAELIETLLRDGPTLRILGTSREAVGVAGELEYPLMPLAVPSAAADPVETTDAAAVRLFLERSSPMDDVAATPTAIATVAGICRDLDGIPLALELAAARTRTLSVDEIAAHLDDRFGFLKYWRRVAVPRHQTLQATMDWSYELLSEQEREVLRRLSVFAGGFTLRTAAAVCVGGGEAEALDLVGRLVERSLVVADVGEGETRYRLLETVRQYASARLAEAGEVDDTRRAHAVAFVRVAIEGALGGEAGLSRLAAERDNVLAALEWSLSAGDDSGPELACAYGRFWLSGGLLQEAGPWLERALSAHRLRDELRAELLGLLGAVLHASGDLARADEVLSEGLQLARACANRALEARLLIRQTTVHVFLGVTGYNQALGVCEEAATVLESAGDFAALADAWVAIGMFHFWLGETSSEQAALERGAAYARRSGNRPAELLAQRSLARSFVHLTVATDIAIERQEQLLDAVKGDPYSEAHVLEHLALMYGFAGRFAVARSAISRCRAVWAESGAMRDSAASAIIAGTIELLAGDPLAAEREFREGHESLLAMQQVAYRATLTLLLAESLYAQGRYEEAERLVEEVAATEIDDDLIDQVFLRIIGAKLRARDGEFDAAERLSHEAKELAPSWNERLLGEVLVGSAEVLILAGKADEAAEALGEAVRLYEERRAEPLAERARKQLEELAAHPLAPPH